MFCATLMQGAIWDDWVADWTFPSSESAITYRSAGLTRVQELLLSDARHCLESETYLKNLPSYQEMCAGNIRRLAQVAYQYASWWGLLFYAPSDNAIVEALGGSGSGCSDLEKIDRYRRELIEEAVIDGAVAFRVQAIPLLALMRDQLRKAELIRRVFEISSLKIVVPPGLQDQHLLQREYQLVEKGSREAVFACLSAIQNNNLHVLRLSIASSSEMFRNMAAELEDLSKYLGSLALVTEVYGQVINLGEFSNALVRLTQGHSLVVNAYHVAYSSFQHHVQAQLELERQRLAIAQAEQDARRRREEEAFKQRLSEERMRREREQQAIQQLHDAALERAHNYHALAARGIAPSVQDMAQTLAQLRAYGLLNDVAGQQLEILCKLVTTLIAERRKGDRANARNLSWCIEVANKYGYGRLPEVIWAANYLNKQAVNESLSMQVAAEQQAELDWYAQEKARREAQAVAAQQAELNHYAQQQQANAQNNPFEQQDNLCSICLDEDEIALQEMYKTSCGHKFHKSCIESWLKKQRTCPACRTRL